MGGGINNIDKCEDFCSNYKTSKVVFLPIPYDGTSTYCKGADKGPAAMIEAYPNLEFYDVETDFEYYPEHIFVEKPIKEKKTPELMVEATEKEANKHLSNNKFLVGLGGEHSVSAGLIYAHSKKYKNMTVLQFDAHADLREEYHGTKNNHACIIKRAQDVAKTVQVGIRSVSASEKNNFQKVFFAHDIYNDEKKNVDWIKKVVESLSDNVYVTIDLDVFDSSIMPSTGTPEPGGLNFYQVTNVLKEVAKTKKIVGFDVVELLPRKENPSPDFLAAKLIFKILVYKQKYGG